MTPTMVWEVEDRALESQVVDLISFLLVAEGSRSSRTHSSADPPLSVGFAGLH